MTAAQIAGLLILLVLSIATALILYVLIRRSLGALLDETLKLPPATAFYNRILFIGLMLVAVGHVIDRTFKMGEDPVFMDYVWGVTSGLSTVFLNVIWYVVAYLVITTILLVVFRRQVAK